jgi:hypothetical protein
MTRETPAATGEHAADIIVPEQFFPAVSALADPERRLRLAILQDALRYYQQYAAATDRRARALYEDAAEWFASPDRSEPFSFVNVCDALGLDASYIRRGLQRWRDRALATGTPSRLAVVRERVRREGPHYGGTGGSQRRAA